MNIKIGIAIVLVLIAGSFMMGCTEAPTAEEYNAKKAQLIDSMSKENTVIKVVVFILPMEDARGEPVPGADIFIEQEPDDEPIIIIDKTLSDIENTEKMEWVSSWLGVKEDISSPKMPARRPTGIRRNDTGKGLEG